MTVAGESTSSASAARFTVLLASENDPWHQNVHQTVRGLLEPQGVVTLSARTGREALAVMERQTVHVAVLDMRMPQLGGLQVVRLMRELPHAPASILLADDPSGQLLRDALAMQVFSVLAKPVDYAQLLDALARVMRRFHNSQWPRSN